MTITSLDHIAPWVDERVALRVPDVAACLGRIASRPDGPGPGSADAARAEAVSRGFAVDRVVDAPHTIAVLLRGPEQLSIELVEHEPSYSLV